MRQIVNLVIVLCALFVVALSQGLSNVQIGNRVFTALGVWGSLGTTAVSWATVANSCKKDEKGNRPAFECVASSIGAVMTTMGAAAQVWTAWNTFGAVSAAYHVNNVTAGKYQWNMKPRHKAHQSLFDKYGEGRYLYGLHVHDNMTYHVAAGKNEYGQWHTHVVRFDGEEDHGINGNFDDLDTDRFEGVHGDDANKVGAYVAGWWRDQDTSADCLNVEQFGSRVAMYALSAGPGQGNINAEEVCHLKV